MSVAGTFRPFLGWCERRHFPELVRALLEVSTSPHHRRLEMKRLARAAMSTRSEATDPSGSQLRRETTPLNPEVSEIVALVSSKVLELGFGFRE